MRARVAPDAEDIARRIRGGEERALARLLTGLEDAEPWAGAALRKLRRDAVTRNSHIPDTRNSQNLAEGGRPAGGPSQVIGITGAPGTGKSTLVDKLIAIYRARGDRVGVLAVDPSSPFTGGAILGDRIRMRPDEGVFIRSLASRGRLGGLSRASAQCSRALEAAGYGIVLVETVGIGQSEVDVARLADSVVLVAMPGSGDDIQTIKAGVMEIGDVFVVNKADREGADKAVREIRSMLEIADGRAGHHAAPAGGAAPALEELPPVLKTVAETGEGVPGLVAALDARWAKLKGSGELEARRKRGAVAEARALLQDRVLAELEAMRGGLEEALAEEIVRGEREAGEAADLLFESMRKGEGK